MADAEVKDNDLSFLFIEDVHLSVKNLSIQRASAQLNSLFQMSSVKNSTAKLFDDFVPATVSGFLLVLKIDVHLSAGAGTSEISNVFIHC